MSRRSFLIGHLTGLLVGAALMFAGESLRHKNQPSSSPLRATPISFPAPPPTARPDWHQFDFNGRPVYIVPLGEELSRAPPHRS
jgi:hypothetical protein